MLRLALLAIAACLTGCDMVKAGFTPAAEKINEAFPLPDEVQVARTRLLASLEGDKVGRQRVAGQLGKLMEVRALTCTALAPAGRFDTPAKIKSKVTDANCFVTQDAALEEWVGMQRVAIALNGAPLVPITPLPARSLLPNTTDTIATAAIAAGANVLVVRTQQQQFIALQLPTGKQISAFTSPEQSYRAAAVSPNGRLVAVPGNKGMRFFDVETGQSLWNTQKYSEVIAWLPQVQAIVLSQAGTSAPFAMDARLAKIEPYPAAEKRLTWSAPLAGDQLLVGNQNTASVMQHARSAAGALEVSAIRQWTLPSPGITNGVPHLMQQGKKLVWLSARDLGWLDLESGQQGTWSLASLNVSAIAKAGETNLVFNVYVQGTGIETRVLDVDTRTVATAKDLDGRDGQLFALPPRAAFLKRSSNAVVLAGRVEGENPQDLERLVADANLAQQLAKLDPTQAPGYSPERAAQIEALARRVRALNTASAIRDGLPRDVVERIRRGSGPGAAADAAAAAAAAAQAAAYARGSPAARSQPMLANVPADARVAFVGVYEPEPRGGNVRINVAQDSLPLVLVLSSYESVNWVINPGGRKIAAVLVSGYQPSTVTGQGKADVLRVGSRYAYKVDSPEYLNLKADVARYINNPIQSFQGSYKGKAFEVR